MALQVDAAPDDIHRRIAALGQKAGIDLDVGDRGEQLAVSPAVQTGTCISGGISDPDTWARAKRNASLELMVQKQRRQINRLENALQELKQTDSNGNRSISVPEVQPPPVSEVPESMQIFFENLQQQLEYEKQQAAHWRMCTRLQRMELEETLADRDSELQGMQNQIADFREQLQAQQDAFSKVILEATTSTSSEVDGQQTALTSARTALSMLDVLALENKEVASNDDGTPVSPLSKPLPQDMMSLEQSLRLTQADLEYHKWQAKIKDEQLSATSGHITRLQAFQARALKRAGDARKREVCLLEELQDARKLFSQLADPEYNGAAGQAALASGSASDAVAKLQFERSAYEGMIEAILAICDDSGMMGDQAGVLMRPGAASTTTSLIGVFLQRAKSKVSELTTTGEQDSNSNGHIQQLFQRLLSQIEELTMRCMEESNRGREAAARLERISEEQMETIGQCCEARRHEATAVLELRKMQEAAASNLKVTSPGSEKTVVESPELKATLEAIGGHCWAAAKASARFDVGNPDTSTLAAASELEVIETAGVELELLACDPQSAACLVLAPVVDLLRQLSGKARRAVALERALEEVRPRRAMSPGRPIATLRLVFPSVRGPTPQHFEDELRISLGRLGAERVPELSIDLIEGQFTAELSGPSNAVQELRDVPLASLTVLGHQAIEANLIRDNSPLATTRALRDTSTLSGRSAGTLEVVAADRPLTVAADRPLTSRNLVHALEASSVKPEVGSTPGTGCRPEIAPKQPITIAAVSRETTPASSSAFMNVQKDATPVTPALDRSMSLGSLDQPRVQIGKTELQVIPDGVDPQEVSLRAAEMVSAAQAAMDQLHQRTSPRRVDRSISPRLMARNVLKPIPPAQGVRPPASPPRPLSNTFSVLDRLPSTTTPTPPVPNVRYGTEGGSSGSMNVAVATNLQAGSMCVRPGGSSTAPSSMQHGSMTVPARNGADVQQGSIAFQPGGTISSQMSASQDAPTGGRSVEMPVYKPQPLVSRPLATTFNNTNDVGLNVGRGRSELRTVREGETSRSPQRTQPQMTSVLSSPSISLTQQNFQNTAMSPPPLPSPIQAMNSRLGQPPQVQANMGRSYRFGQSALVRNSSPVRDQSIPVHQASMPMLAPTTTTSALSSTVPSAGLGTLLQPVPNLLQRTASPVRLVGRIGTG